MWFLGAGTYLKSLFDLFGCILIDFQLKRSHLDPFQTQNHFLTTLFDNFVDSQNLLKTVRKHPHSTPKHIPRHPQKSEKSTPT